MNQPRMIDVSERLCQLELDDTHILKGYALGHLRDMKAEIDRLRAEVETLRAQLHGMQDGSLVRDQAAEIDRLRAEVEECREHLMTVLYYCPGGFPKAEAYLNRTQKEGE